MSVISIKFALIFYMTLHLFLQVMPDNYEEWPITRVKLIYGRLEATWLTFQILVSLTSLTLIILTHIKDLKPSGSN
nr:hypothetical protein [Torque teno Leptonychotes weddellii virus 3]